MNNTKVIGYLMMTLGLLMVTNLLGLGLVILDTQAPAITSSVPSYSSTTVGLSPSTLYRLKLYFADDKDNYALWRATVSIAGGSAVYMAPSVTGGIYNGYFFYDWTSPSSASDITFVFTAIDYSGNTASKTATGVVGKPAGDFYINGQKVTADSVIRLKSPALSLKISVTSLASYVSDEIVTVVMGSNTATVSGSSWTKSGNDYTNSYSLAWGDGTYTITAQLKDTSNNLITLSIVGVSVNGLEMPDIPLTTYQMFGMILTAAGFCVVLLSKKKQQ